MPKVLSLSVRNALQFLPKATLKKEQINKMSAMRSAARRLRDAAIVVRAATPINPAQHLNKPSVITPEYVVSQIREERDVMKALNFFNKATKYEYPRGYRHDDSTYGVMIGRLAASSRFPEAESLLLRMAEESTPTESIFIALCGGYGAAHKPFEALRTFHRMSVEFNVTPTDASYVAVFRVLVNENCHDAAFKFYTYMRSKGCVTVTVQVCNILIKALCAEAKTLDRALGVLADMKKRQDCEPDNYTYGTLIHGLCKHGRVEEAKKMFELIPEPDPIVRTSFISGILIHSDETDLALKEFDEIKKMTKPSNSAYKVLIHGLCMWARSLDGAKVLHQMIIDGYYPSPRDYSAVVKGFCNEGRHKDALKTLDQMMMRCFIPKVSLYYAVIKCLCENPSESPRSAAALLREMSIHGVLPSPMSKRHFEEMYMLVIRRLCEDNDVEEAYKFYAKIRDGFDGVYALPGVYGPLILGLYKERDFSRAQRVLDEMLERKCVPDDAIGWRAAVMFLYTRNQVFRDSVDSSWEFIEKELLHHD